MKTLIFSCLAGTALLTFSACEADGEHGHDHDRASQTTMTTTEETTVHHPVQATTETRTTRSY